MTEGKNNSNEQAADREFVMTPVGKCFEFVCAEIQFEEARILFGGSQSVETTITAIGPKKDGLKNPGVCSFKN